MISNTNVNKRQLCLIVSKNPLAFVLLKSIKKYYKNEQSNRHRLRNNKFVCGST